MRVTTAIYQDKRNKKKDGTYPIKLRVTFNREQRYYPTKYSLTKEDFKKVQGEKPRGNFKDIALDLNSVERKAKAVIDSLPVFAWKQFERKFSTDGAMH